jgi:NADPH:quinone reductase-like Zn-dependent oxidoreductase
LKEQPGCFHHYYKQIPSEGIPSEGIPSEGIPSEGYTFVKTMQNKIPGTMQAVCLGEDDKLISRSVPVPQPSKGEVLVKMSSAPVNPSDLTRIKHLSSSEKKLFIAGIEGSGTVVAHGKGLVPKIWMGRRVACSTAHISSGTWAEYLVTNAMSCVPLPPGINDEQGSMLIVNPMTAVAFMRIAKAGHHKAIINTAASGSLGRLIEVLARRHRITLIQVVKSEKQRESLLSAGAQYVINSSKDRFEVDIHSAAKKLNARLAFDAVGGEMTRRLLMAMPFGSTVIVYGNLSAEQPLIDHRSLVSDNKKVKGFYLVNWLNENGILNTLTSILEARKLLNGNISVPVQARFKLDSAQLAVDTYLANMTGGKVILVP